MHFETFVDQRKFQNAECSGQSTSESAATAMGERTTLQRVKITLQYVKST